MKKIKISYIRKRICLLIISSLKVNKQKLITFVRKTDHSAICCRNGTTGAIIAKNTRSFLTMLKHVLAAL